MVVYSSPNGHQVCLSCPLISRIVFLLTLL